MSSIFFLPERRGAAVTGKSRAGESPTRRRVSGVLLHPTSLPGPGIGDVGPEAFRFVEWLADAGQTFWQILPLGPVDPEGSPYNGLSALAGNPLLISPERLFEEGLIDRADLEEGERLPASWVDFDKVFEWKEHLLRSAHRRFGSRRAPRLAAAFDEFRAENESWLPDYSLFRALRDLYSTAPWPAWPQDVRSRDPLALERSRELLADEVESYAFRQFLFDSQWRALHRHAEERGVQIIGDLPIFVAHDSADVWANREIFRLDEAGSPYVVAGVPPDYFSALGQRWGNPLYRWDVLREREYFWWTERFRRTLSLVDVVRVDHFRGFHACWEIPASEETAVNGVWVPGPGEDLFHQLRRSLGPLPVIAEDLGLIDRGVEELREAVGFPGMRVLQFGFDGDPANLHHPSNYPVSCVAYTGTHDNDTIMGWWKTASGDERERVRNWISRHDPTHWEFVQRILDCPAAIAIVPLQDLLGLGSEARMNTPGQRKSSWRWRMAPGAIRAENAEMLREATFRSGRLPEIV